ncbi:hypothetical protein [Microbacterium arborescens]|nr:hypothetical protein [Microbacterium arborescens]
MAEVLVECRDHGVLPARGLVAGDGLVRITGGSMPCPWCGKQARVLDGDYGLKDTLRLPTVFMPSPAERNRLRNIMQWAESKLADTLRDDSAVVESLERGLLKDAPAVAGMLDSLGGAKSMGIATWLMVLLMIYQMVVAGQGVSADDVQRIVNEGVEQLQGQRDDVAPRGVEPSPLPEPPTPSGM